MLIRHPRIPALLVLTAAMALCVLYLRSYGRIVGANDPAGNPSSLESLESAIAGGNAGPQTWLTYGTKLQEINRQEDAAVAYQKYLDANPYDHDVQLSCAKALATAGDDKRLYDFLKGLLYENPKMIVDLLANTPRQSTPPFDSLYRDAVSQAMD